MPEDLRSKYEALRQIHRTERRKEIAACDRQTEIEELLKFICPYKIGDRFERTRVRKKRLRTTPGKPLDFESVKRVDLWEVNHISIVPVSGGETKTAFRWRAGMVNIKKDGTPGVQYKALGGLPFGSFKQPSFDFDGTFAEVAT